MIRTDRSFVNEIILGLKAIEKQSPAFVATQPGKSAIGERPIPTDVRAPAGSGQCAVLPLSFFICRCLYSHSPTL